MQLSTFRGYRNLLPLLIIFIAGNAFAQQTFTFQQGVDGYYGCTDAHIFIDKPDWNTGGEDMFEATGNGGEADAKHALVRFDLSCLSGETVIDSAWISLYFTQRRTPQTNTKHLGVYRLNRTWGEGTGTDPGGYDGRPAVAGECNWNYAIFDTDAWELPGCNGVPDDREGTPGWIDTFYTSTPINTWYSWSITNMCQYWIDHPDSNFGFVLREPTVSSAGGILDFASSEYDVIDYRPELRIRLFPQPETHTDTVTETHTYNSISVCASYGGDTDNDGSATLNYKLSDGTEWSPDITMEKQPFLYEKTITGLDPGSLYDIRVTYYDPDGVIGENPKFIYNIQLYDIITFTDSLIAEVLGPNVIKVDAPYWGDANLNGTAVLEHKISEESFWINDGDMSRMDSYYQKMLIGLLPDTNYDVRVTYYDPDGVIGENPRQIYGLHTPQSEESVTLNSLDTTHFNITMANYTIEYDKDNTSGYILIYPTSNPSDALATRTVHGSLFELTLPEYVQAISGAETDNEIIVTINISRVWADFTIYFHVYKNSPGLVRWRTNVSSNQPVTILDNPRDLIFYDRSSHKSRDVNAIKYVKQFIYAAGVCYLYEDATNSTIFYLEDFSSLNDYYSIRSGWSPDFVVDAEGSYIGYARPYYPTTTIPAGTNFDIVDTYVYLIPGQPSSEVEKAERYLYCLSSIYNQMYKPDIIEVDWHEIVSNELTDLLDDRCWVTLSNVDFLRAYVNIPRFDSAELIAQLDVLIPLEEYEEVVGDVTEIDDILEQTLPYFYNGTHETIVNNYPNEGISEGDSWYAIQLLLGLAKLAKMDNTMADVLLFLSIPTIIDFAHNVDYEFPVFFDYYTNDAISGSEPDVAGGYAYLMLDCYELTGEQTYLDEAEASISHIVGKGFNLAYELHMTAACAAACARLNQLTGNNDYLLMSYMPLANIMQVCWLWECDYGYASDYLTFWGMSPMQEAGVITMKEQYETWRYLREYMELVSDLIPDYINNLVEGYVIYSPAVMKYSLAPFLPEDAVWTGTTIYGAVNIPSMYIPLEDLRQGWHISGQIGQEIYGAGGPIAFATEAAGIEEEQSTTEKKSFLKSFPNPFNKTLLIDYYLNGEKPVMTSLRIYNISGQLIKTLINEEKVGGKYKIFWDGTDNSGRSLSNGVYFINLERGNVKETKKILLVR